MREPEPKRNEYNRCRPEPTSERSGLVSVQGTRRSLVNGSEPERRLHIPFSQNTRNGWGVSGTPYKRNDMQHNEVEEAS